MREVSSIAFSHAFAADGLPGRDEMLVGRSMTPAVMAVGTVGGRPVYRRTGLTRC